MISLKSVLNPFKPQDPSLLAYLRIVYGLLMMCDILIERGMPYMDSKFSDDYDNCRFPLIHGTEPLRYNYMALIYTALAICAFFITVGFLFKLSTLVFAIGYWYIFLLNKAVWNNHSYLYGLISIILFNSNANYYCSIDALIFKGLKNKEIPNIQYIMIRLQIFIVYFFAGIKKTDQDWIQGYSMGKLSRSWVFDPVKAVGLSDEFIDQYIVHYGGFIIDLVLPWFLLFDKTRWITFTVFIGFHGMNSQLFHIGMFSYTCLATMFIFCHPDSFRKFLRDSSSTVRNYANCKYFTDKKSDDNDMKLKKSEKEKETKSGWNKLGLFAYFKLSIAIVYISIQLFLPWSHFITLGYNGWTQGTYGYSWDMMIHSFATQHVKIKYVDPVNDRDGYLKSDAFTAGRASSRWTSHPEQLWQYADCLKDKLIDLGVGNETSPPELYFDVWKSMNKRFHQRVYRPDVNIVKAEWSPFNKPSYTLPLLASLNEWRGTMKEIGRKIMEDEDEHTEVTFIADFPGMYLENYLNKDLTDTRLTILEGEVEVHVLENENADEPLLPEEFKSPFTLKKGESTPLPANFFHNVHTSTNGPACYMFVYVNTTHKTLVAEIEKHGEKIEKLIQENPDFDPLNHTYNDTDVQKIHEMYNDKQKYMLQRNETRNDVTRLDKFLRFVEKKLHLARRSCKLSQHVIMEMLGYEVTYNMRMSLEFDLILPHWVFTSAPMVNNRIRRAEFYEYRLENPPNDDAPYEVEDSKA